jgi:hypothetical protein
MSGSRSFGYMCAMKEDKFCSNGGSAVLYGQGLVFSLTELCLCAAPCPFRLLRSSVISREMGYGGAQSAMDGILAGEWGKGSYNLDVWYHLPPRRWDRFILR